MLKFIWKSGAFLPHAGLSVVGSGLAIGSAAFAGYMVTRTPEAPYFGGLEHLAIFAQPSRPSAADVAAAREQLARELAQFKPLDMTPIGTIDRRSQKAPQSAPSINLPLAESHLLISLVGQKALVQGPNGVKLYDRGEDIPGYGKFQTVERFGQGWSIVTDKGRISDASRRPPAGQPPTR